MISVDLMSLWNAVCSVLLCSSVRKNMSFYFCHYVIMSLKTHLSPLMPCVLLSKDVYVCIFYKLSIISLHTQFFLLNLHN